MHRGGSAALLPDHRRLGAGPPETWIGQGRQVITIADETGVANLVIWPSRYERQRRIILAVGMIAVQGRVQREGEVAHLSPTT
jgi:DNA polymerase III alpha subunit